MSEGKRPHLAERYEISLLIVYRRLNRFRNSFSAMVETNAFCFDAVIDYGLFHRDKEDCLDTKIT